MRAEAESFVQGVIWGCAWNTGGTLLDLVEAAKAEALKRWPDFDPPSEADLAAGKNRLANRDMT